MKCFTINGEMVCPAKEKHFRGPLYVFKNLFYARIKKMVSLESSEEVYFIYNDIIKRKGFSENPYLLFLIDGNLKGDSYSVFFSNEDDALKYVEKFNATVNLVKLEEVTDIDENMFLVEDYL